MEKSLYYAMLASAIRTSRKLTATFGSPTAASDFFADKSRKYVLDSLDNPSLADVQALLLLVLLDWGSSRGTRAFMYLGMAARMALTHLPATEHRSDGYGGVSTPDFLVAETARRTIWMAFMSEQFLCSGSGRFPVLRVDDLRISLPSTEIDYLFGIPGIAPLYDGSIPYVAPTSAVAEAPQGTYETRITQLSSPAAAAAAASTLSNLSNISPMPEIAHADAPRPRPPSNISSLPMNTPQGTTSEFGAMVKISNIWHKVATWRFRQPPNADHDTRQIEQQLMELENKLYEWKAALPSTYQDRPEHLMLHMSLGTGFAFGFIHCVYHCARILLHRERLYYAYSQTESPFSSHANNTQGNLSSQSHSHVHAEGAASAPIEAIFSSAERIIEIITTLETVSEQDDDTLAVFPIFMLYACFTASAAVAYLSIKQWTRSRQASFRIVRDGLRILRSMKSIWPLLEEWHTKLSAMVKVLQDRVMGREDTIATATVASDVPSLETLQYGHVGGARRMRHTPSVQSARSIHLVPSALSAMTASLSPAHATSANVLPEQTSPTPVLSHVSVPAPDYEGEGYVLAAGAEGLGSDTYFDLDQFLHNQDSLSAFLGVN